MIKNYAVNVHRETRKRDEREVKDAGRGLCSPKANLAILSNCSNDYQVITTAQISRLFKFVHVFTNLCNTFLTQ